MGKMLFFLTFRLAVNPKEAFIGIKVYKKINELGLDAYKEIHPD